MERYGEFNLKIEGVAGSIDYSHGFNGSLADYSTFNVRIYHDGKLIRPSNIKQVMKAMDKYWRGSGGDNLEGKDVPLATLNNLRMSLIRETGDIDEVEIPYDGREATLPIQIQAKLRVRNELDDLLS